MTDEWDRGRWCDVCHQKHYQISPACARRRKEREALAANLAAWEAQGVAPMPELRDLMPIPWERARTMGFPYNVPNGADEEEDERAWTIESVINSQALAGILVKREEAERLYDEAQRLPMPKIGEGREGR